MLLVKKTFVILILFFVALSCKHDKLKTKELLFWSSNNNGEIKLSTRLVNEWNTRNPNHKIHVQPIPEGQSSEEVILAAVVGKTTPDIYGNMWQGNVEMYARAGVLVPLDTIKGFLEFIYERCDSAVIKEITSSDGHIYQVPWKVNPIMTIYNEDVFLANGITQVPKTYSAYRQAAEMYKNNSKKRG
ncbi:MAG: ABC transporter substrate-binding protein, partial [Chitinophagaceae bacterium]